jgi:NAD-dependent DNA ligase
MLENINDLFDQMAYQHKESTGLEALALRGYEQVSKVSLILAVPEGVRTVEHVRWAYALIRRDIESKMRLVLANDTDKTDPAQALTMTLLQTVDGPDGETAGVIARRLCRKWKRPDIDAALNKLVEAGRITKEVSIHKYNKSKSIRYRLVHST